MTSERDDLSKFRDAFLDYLEGDRNTPPPRWRSCRKNSAGQVKPSSNRSRQHAAWIPTLPDRRSNSS